MLLARKGHLVLLVDRATFPSDTLSTNTYFSTSNLPGGTNGVLYITNPSAGDDQVVVYAPETVVVRV